MSPSIKQVVPLPLVPAPLPGAEVPLPPVERIAQYLADPFLDQLYRRVWRAGPLRAAIVDLTHNCNIRCQGCYFFADHLDQHKAPRDEAVFDAFVEQEKARGTNYLTVAGGEPSLMLPRVQKLYRHFWVVTVTNGLIRIPEEGLENLALQVSVWGDHATDTQLRGGGKVDVFARALRNYKDDDRVTWNYTTTPGNAHEIPSVVDQCVQNGNYVTFSFYGDISGRGGAVDHRQGFGRVRDEIDRAIDRYPDRILLSRYVAGVISTGRLFGDTWGHHVCASISAEHPLNAERIRNGKPYSPHFRAYNPDLQSIRRCCVGNDRDCGNCFETWPHMSWIMLGAARHLESRQEFTNWLTTVYLFYLMARAVDFHEGVTLLPEIHRRLRNQLL
jgi:hypothetical protein